MRENKVKTALRAGKPVVGTMITEFRTPEIARILASSGFDFIFIDTEHAAFDNETVTDIIRAGRAVGLVCMVRVPDAEYHLIARALDIGAEGILVPRVESKPQVQSIVSWAKYPPIGVLGVHMMAPYASELIHECALAIKLKATINDLASTVHAHPTLAEAVKEAALDAKGEAIHILRQKHEPQ